MRNNISTKKAWTCLTIALGLLAAPTYSQSPKPDKDTHPDSTITPCGNCDLILYKIAIVCQNGATTSERPDLQQQPGSSLTWTAGSRWQIAFSGASPCREGRTLNNQHSTCTIKANARAATYNYAISLQGCKRRGNGRIVVTRPARKIDHSVVTSCKNCDLKMHGSSFAIGCNNAQTTLTNLHARALQGAQFSWQASPDVNWHVNFTGASPCKEGSSFSSTNAACSIADNVQTSVDFPYTVSVDSCGSPINATIMVTASSGQ